VFFFDANGNQILNLDLEVSVDSKAVKKLIDRTIPGNAIVVDSTGKNIVLKGTVANGQDSKLAEDLVEQSLNGQCDCKVVNAMKIAEGDQVMLKVRVVELKRSLLKDFGIRTSTNISVGNFGFNFKTGGRGYSGKVPTASPRTSASTRWNQRGWPRRLPNPLSRPCPDRLRVSMLAVNSPIAFVRVTTMEPTAKFSSRPMVFLWTSHPPS